MESAFIRWLRGRLPNHPCLRLGPGDDAAVLRLASGADVVVTVDLLTDGVDFVLSETDPRRVGRKALAVNLSDLAAMAARPLAALVAAVLPRQGGFSLGQALFEGLLPLAEEYGVAIAGGDTNSWDGPLGLCVTAIGEPTPRGVWTRRGARPGDAIVATGEFGGSILGRHLDFEPRLNEALAIAEKYSVRAAIDVSDGLARDLAHICEESGCGAVLYDGAIPIADAARKLAALKSDGRSPLDHALEDGEDFELVLAAAPEEAQSMTEDRSLGVRLTRIGEFVPEAGLWRVGADGVRRPLAARGYEHSFH